MDLGCGCWTCHIGLFCVMLPMLLFIWSGLRFYYYIGRCETLKCLHMLSEYERAYECVKAVAVPR